MTEKKREGQHHVDHGVYFDDRPPPFEPCIARAGTWDGYPELQAAFVRSRDSTAPSAQNGRDENNLAAQLYTFDKTDEELWAMARDLAELCRYRMKGE